VSPVTHALTGWLIAQPLHKRSERVAVTCAAVIADLDGLSLLGGVDAYHKWHHTFGHNVFFAFAVSIGIGVYFRSLKSGLLGLVAFHSHILEDMLGSGAGWGVPYFWPASERIYSTPQPFQWELDSWQNLAFTAIFLIATLWLGLKKRRTIVEVFSEKADLKVVTALGERFKKSA
jgi:inner membrane protein